MNQRGAVTIFFCIIFLCIIVLVGTVVDAARLNAARHHIRMSADAALFSSLSEYEPELKNEYSLFAREIPDQDKVVTFLKGTLLSEAGPDLFGYQIKPECVTVSGRYPLSNDEVMKHQILEYMKYRGPAELIKCLDQLLDNLDKITPMLDQATEAMDLMDKLAELEVILNEAKNLKKDIRAKLGKKQGDKFLELFSASSKDNYTKQIIKYIDLRDAEGEEDEDELKNLAADIQETYAKIEALFPSLKDVNELKQTLVILDSKVTSLLDDLKDANENETEEETTFAGSTKKNLLGLRKEIIRDKNLANEIENYITNNYQPRIKPFSPNRLQTVLKSEIDYKLGTDTQGFFYHCSMPEFDYQKAGEPNEESESIWKTIKKITKGFSLNFSDDIGWGTIDGIDVPSNQKDTEDVPEMSSGEIKSLGKTISQDLKDLRGRLLLLVERLYVNEYMFEKFSTQADVITAFRQAQDKDNYLYKDQVLKAQVEYLLYGSKTDKKNCESAKWRIAGIRFMSNLIYIITNGDMLNQIIAVTSGLGIAAPVAQALIIAGWAIVETQVDLYMLINGKSVPLIKASNDWITRLKSLGSTVERLAGENNGNKEKGLSYNMYLRILLLTSFRYDKVFHRIQDLIYVESDQKLDSRKLYSYLNIDGQVKVKNWFLSQSYMSSVIKDADLPRGYTTIKVSLYRGY